MLRAAVRIAILEDAEEVVQQSSDLSCVASIQSWLHGVQQPKDDFPPRIANILSDNPRASNRKRRSLSMSDSDEPTIKRIRTSTPQTTFSIRSPSRPTARRTAIPGTTVEVSASTPARATNEVNALQAVVDQDPTPRANNVIRQPSSPSLSSRSSVTTRSSQGESGRQRSPVKRIGDFGLSNTQIRMVEFSNRTVPKPEDTSNLYKDLRRVESQKQVIPESVAALALPYLQELGYEDVPVAVSSEQSRDVAEDLDEWNKVLAILEAADECRSAALPESAWNAEVHSTLLRLSLSGEWREKGVWYRDITSAKIHDHSLLPAIGSGLVKTVLESKMVDYAMIIEPSPYLAARVRDSLVSEGRRSINHTQAEHMRYTPITVSIETKRAGIDEDAADVQTSMWLSAHLARLRQMDPSLELPSLPQIITQGHDWRLRIAKADDAQGLTIWRDLRVGDTSSVLGIYQLLKSLRILAQWSLECYLPNLEQRLTG